MFRVIFGWIALIWGGLIVLNMIMRGGPQGEGPQWAGQATALGFGVVMLIAGWSAVFRSRD